MLLTEYGSGVWFWTFKDESVLTSSYDSSGGMLSIQNINGGTEFPKLTLFKTPC